MAFTLYSLFKAALLVLNAVAVLHERRFLKEGVPLLRHSAGVRSGGTVLTAPTVAAAA